MVSLQQLAQEGDKRNAAVYTWLRWLVVLAAGSFAAILGLMGAKPLPLLQFFLVKTALMYHVVGILSGSIALYGEVFVARQMVKSLGMACINTLNGNHAAEPSGVNVSPLPKIFLFSEKLCYSSLIAALICLAALVYLL